MNSSRDIANLLERFEEPLRSEDGFSPPPETPVFAAPDRNLPRPADETARPATVAMAAPVPRKKSGIGVKRLVVAAVAFALVPAAALAALWWQSAAPGAGAPDTELSVTSPPSETAAAEPAPPPAPAADTLEVALTSPERIEANAGAFIPFPIVIDATAALPARAILAVTELPEGASFSEGRPFGASGWSLRPDEIGGLRLRLPARSASADMRLELVTGDGTVLAKSETKLRMAPGPAVVAEASMDDPAPAAETAAADPAEHTASITSLAPPPQRKPEVKVNPVKVVTIAPPKEKRPHDGAYALGSAAEPEASAEWMETKTAVDMHARAEQKSETVKVADGGVKLIVKGRDKNWIQVHDPKSATTGWIYNRFLKPADAPAQ